MAGPDLSVQVVIAIAISGTALVGVMMISIYLCSQAFGKSREAYRIQRASSIQNKAPETSQRRTTLTQDERVIPPPHRLQHSPPRWPFPNDGPSIRAWHNERVENPGSSEQQLVPDHGQQSYRPLESTQRNERSSNSRGPTPLAQNQYSDRRAELPTSSGPALPLWRQQLEELHFGS